jgi:hypothetical protein
MPILDVAIGLVFVYLVLSLAVTAANEAAAAWFKRRAWMLQRGVVGLLGDKALAQDVFNHPLIKGLKHGRLGPSYIPSRTFAIALLDTLHGGKGPKGSVAREIPESLAHALAVLKREAGSDLDHYKDYIEIWFSQAMERVSGAYRRRTQALLLIWAAVVTIGANADTFVIANRLWTDPSLRQAVVARAERYAAEEQRPQQPAAQQAVDIVAPGPPPLPPYEQADVDFQQASARYDAAISDLRTMELPFGWRPRQPPADENAEPATDFPELRLFRDDATEEWPGALWEEGAIGRWLQALDAHTFGWLITILAVSLGAPFWFDTLNRIIAIRSAGRAPEERPRPPKVVPKAHEPGADDKPEIA